MEDIFITICGTSNYYGAVPLKIGTIVKVTRDRDNMFDSNAFSVSLPSLGIVGYVANSSATVAEGTSDAASLCPMIADEAFCRIMFKTEKYIIGKILF